MPDHCRRAAAALRGQDGGGLLGGLVGAAEAQASRKRKRPGRLRARAEIHTNRGGWRRRIHGSAEHSGKVPKRSGGKIELRKKIKDIRKELEAYILAEEYEMAAKLRDEIRTIEAQIAQNN